MRAVRLAGRALTITLFFLGHALRWWVGWLVLLVAFRSRARRQEWFGDTVLSLFRGLGATFIKVGQIMSTRPDLFPPHVIRALEKLQDQVGPFPYEAVAATFVEDFGRLPDEVFDSFEKEPIASASVAQVHRARKDGRALAVKVRRPGLPQIVELDLAYMRGVGRLLALSPSIRLMAPVETIEEFGRGIRMQLDFTVEAENNRRFSEAFRGDPDVMFPALVPELCSERVLTMEYIAGQKILQARRDDKTRLARVGFRVMLKMIFQDGFVHADLHPGNIFVTDDGKVAILDLGLVGVLDDEHRRAFARYFAAWARGDGKTMAHIMTDMSPSAGRIPDPAGFARDVEAFVARYFGKRLGEVQVSVVLFDMLQILRRHRVRANPMFTMVNIAIAVTEGIGKQLDPHIDLMAEALPFFAQFHFVAKAAAPE